MVAGTSLIVLAAGASTRMGCPKQILPWGDSTILEQILTAALDSVCEPIIAVLGANADQIRHFIPDRIQVIVNPLWSAGMHTSIATGLRALQSCGERDAVMLANADQPYITREVFNALEMRFRAGGVKIVASSYAGTLGSPAVFAAELFPELRSLSDGGAQRMIHKHSHEAVSIPWPEGAFDVDTPADYALHWDRLVRTVRCHPHS